MKALPLSCPIQSSGISNETRLRLEEWRGHQIRCGRYDLYAFRAGYNHNLFAKGHYQTRKLFTAIASLRSQTVWDLVANRRGMKSMNDWGYLWYFCAKANHAEIIAGCRTVRLICSRYQLERTIQRGECLLVAVSKTMGFGTFTIALW